MYIYNTCIYIYIYIYIYIKYDGCKSNTRQYITQEFHVLTIVRYTIIYLKEQKESKYNIH